MLQIFDQLLLRKHCYKKRQICLKRRIHIWCSVWTLSCFVVVTNQTSICSSWMTWCTILFLGKSNQQNEILKAPHTFSISVFSPPSIFSFATPQSLTEHGRRVLYHKSDGFSLSAGKQGLWKAPSSFIFSRFHLDNKVCISARFTTVNQQCQPFIYLLLQY